MKNLKFNYFSAKNFLCFGPEGIEIDLKKFGNIVLIRGENLDVMDDEEKAASNGVGKSSIADILIYTLFGKTIKSPNKLKHDNIINNQIGKGLRTEVQWDKYRVVRTRKPNGLKLWESEKHIWNDDTEISLGGMVDTQNLIQEKLGINYETCLNLLVFADQSQCTFLESDAKEKRKIIEDLLSLQMYRAYLEESKEQKNTARSQIKLISQAYENSTTELQEAKKRIDNIKEEEKKWIEIRKLELQALESELIKKEEELSKSSFGKDLEAYDKAQERIEEIKNEIPVKEEKLSETRSIIKQIEEKIAGRKKEKNEIELGIHAIKTLISTATGAINNASNKLKIKDLEGTRCTQCHGIVSKENYSSFIVNAEEVIKEQQELLDRNNKELEDRQQQLKEVNEKITRGDKSLSAGRDKSKKLQNNLSNLHEELKQLNQINKPVEKEYEKTIQADILETKNKIKQKKDQLESDTPYVKLLKQAKEDLLKKEKINKDKKEELDQVSGDLSYYEWWVNGFSSKGIPKFAIKDIIPALNAQVAHWMEFLIDGKIKLLFDDELEESISRNPQDGDPFVYHAMSGGERRRLNLAVSQAFAHVMALSSGTSPSLVFLDEVTTNIDPMGVDGVYNMILELSKDKRVFVTTHDYGLLELLQGCETINLRKKDGFTTLV